MAIPVWPTSLPQALDKEGYSETLQNLTIASQTDTGPAMVRRRASTSVRPITGRLTMTAAQLATLKTFYLTDCRGGALRFSWKDPTTNAAAEMRFVSGKPPAIAPLGWLYQVTLELEILP